MRLIASFLAFSGGSHLKQDLMWQWEREGRQFFDLHINYLSCHSFVLFSSIYAFVTINTSLDQTGFGEASILFSHTEVAIYQKEATTFRQGKASLFIFLYYFIFHTQW